MPALNYYLTNSVDAQNWCALSESAQSAATTGSGWTVGTGATLHSELESGVERASSTFVGTTPPDGTLDATLGDALRTPSPKTGSFVSGNWTVNVGVIAVSNGGAQDGRIRFRLLRSANADGSSATEITAGQIQCGLVTNLATSAEQVSGTTTFNPGAFSLNNEYLFIQVAWERTGAGGMTTSDVLLRTGTASTGTQIVTATFTEILPADGSSAGAGAATGVGSATAAAAGSGAGAGVATAASASVIAAAGTSVGIATIDGQGEAVTGGPTIVEADGSAAGVGSVTGVASATVGADGAANGSGASTGSASAIGTAVASAAGTGAVAGAGAGTSQAAASSAGVATVAAVGEDANIPMSDGVSAGSSSVAAAGAAIATSNSGSAGGATALGDSQTVARAEINGVGVAVCDAESAAMWAALAAASGQATVVAGGIDAAVPQVKLVRVAGVQGSVARAAAVLGRR